MKDVESIRKDIQNKRFSPIYLFHGEETFFIDQLVDELQKHVLTEDEKVFNQHIFYANEVDPDFLVSQCRQFPMMADYQLVIVKEAQHFARDKKLEKFNSYLSQPVPTTILVFAYMHKKVDGRKAFYTQCKKNGTVYYSEEIRDYKLPNYVADLVRSKGLKINSQCTNLIAEHIGTDLSRMYNEVNKLSMILPAGATIDTDVIEKYIGISKNYNTFELNNALGERDYPKIFKIVKHFKQNPKEHPIQLSVISLFGFFSKLLIYHTLKDKSSASGAKALGVHPFVYSNVYVKAARNFPIKKVTQIISYLREADAQSKGVEMGPTTDKQDLLSSLIYKIITV